MPIRVQELIHKFEEGTGARYVKLVFAAFVVIAAAGAYDMAAFRNLSTPEGMDAAQLAWNIAEGKGFTTDYIRPFSVYLLKKKESDALPSAGPTAATNSTPVLAPGADPGRLNGGHPDLANPPLYPLLLAGFFKVIQLSHPDLALQSAFKIYAPDRWIGILNQGLLLVLAGMVFFVARRLFDEPVAWASVIALLGGELLWRFSLSGLSTLLLMNLFLALIMVLIRLESAIREGTCSMRTLTGLAAAVGVLVGLGGMTRYAFGWVIVPVVLWLTALAGPRRATLAMTALAAFLVVMGPWLVRNYTLSGTPFGTAGFALFENTSLFPGDELERSTSPDFSGMNASDLKEKLVGNTRDILQNDLPRLGGSWISAFFLVGLLVPFRSPTLNRLRWFLLSCLVLVVIVQALGRTAPSTDSSPVHSENLLVVLAPLVFVYGASLFFTLFEQLAAQIPAARYLVLGAFCLLACAPLILTFLPPYPSPIVYPPYYPPWIQEKAWSVDKKGLIMTDVPWAVAWYGQRQSIELSVKYKSKPADRFKNDFYELDALRPVNALYLTAKTLKSLELRSFGDWVDADEDAALLNRLRQRVVDNGGREEKKEEDFRVFAAVRERLLANAQPAEEQKGEDWERFALTTLLKSEVPTGFPLRRAPEKLLPEIFLMETERGGPKPIQSSK